MTKKGFSLAVFLDVSAAFDNLDSTQGIKAMKDKGIASNLTNWYWHYLQNRISTVSLNGVTRSRLVKKGCPQGGVLSVLLWNIAFDDLLNRFNKGRVTCVGFADDACLIITGKDLATMYRLMNKAIKTAIQWADKFGFK